MQSPSDTTSYKIATTYTITYEKNDEIGPRISARDMLGLIVESYKEVFYEDYTYVEMGISPRLVRVRQAGVHGDRLLSSITGARVYRFLNTNAKDKWHLPLRTHRRDLHLSAPEGGQFHQHRPLKNTMPDVLQSGLSKNRERYISKLEYQNFLKNMSSASSTRWPNTRTACTPSRSTIRP